MPNPMGNLACISQRAFYLQIFLILCGTKLGADVSPLAGHPHYLVLSKCLLLARGLKICPRRRT